MGRAEFQGSFLSSRQALSNPQRIYCRNGKSILQRGPVKADRGRDSYRLLERVQSRQPDKQNARMTQMLPEYQISEVLIRRQQDRILLPADGQHINVFNPWLHFSYLDHLVAVGPQPVNNGSIEAFIRNKWHLREPFNWVYKVQR